MANIQSAKKRTRQIEVRTQRNRMRRSMIHTAIRSVEEAVSKGKKKEAQDALKAAQPTIMRGVTKGVLHLNTAARRVSRLARQVKALA